MFHKFYFSDFINILIINYLMNINKNLFLCFKKIRKNNIKLSPLGLGCWQFSKNSGFAEKFWSTF